MRIYQPASHPRWPPLQRLAASPLVGSRGRILVMDDEEMICDLLQVLLASLGYEVVCVRDGAKTLGCMSRPGPQASCLPR